MKNKIRNGIYLYPMPITLIGANVKGKPNFMPIAWACFVEHKPPTILIACSQTHYTNMGIKENSTFSVNIPSTWSNTFESPVDSTSILPPALPTSINSK